MSDFDLTGYRFPAEWEPQRAILLSWPHNTETWPAQLDQVQETYLKLIAEITESQVLWLLAPSDESLVWLRSHLKEKGILNDNLEILSIPTFDAWIRDYGPMSLVHATKPTCFTSWVFNGWGGKYDQAYGHDSQVPQALAQLKKYPILDVPHILEGGSIDSNGQGTLLTTTDCLLNANRNAELHQEQIEDLLKQFLKIKKIIWLSAEIKGDDTDGHVDDVARFVSAKQVVCVCEDREDDVNYKPTQALYRQLSESTDQDGAPLEVIKLPMPDPVYCDDLRLPASYANFLITNHKVLVPTYGCRQDEEALKILQGLFPKRKVVGIRANDVVYGLGAFHCLSMQVPE